ncbi:photosystem II assembly protein Psb34 [Lyngbya aestuarii]|uniref:photosystem II assembly protein Psb34 n=1 Tax=Lyngbya aestuarii TaxID=118322 RepID=UPI00403DCC4F
MRYTNKEGKTLNLDENLPSDGSELIPAEVQANTRLDESKLPDVPLAPGYTVDDEGINNNYAIEPDISSAEYPSPKQQRRYIVWGAVAILFVALIVLIAFVVS